MDNGKLRKHRFLKVEASFVGRPNIRLMLIGFMAFSTGMIVGFNIKDIMITTCRVVSSNKIVRHVDMPVVSKHDEVGREVAPAISKEVNPNGKPPREKFTQLPDKFLHDVAMNPPATYFTLKPWRILERAKNATNNDYPPFFMTVLVKSAVAFALRRFQIRQTWGSVTDIEGNRVGVIFVVGMANSEGHQNVLKEENDLYGDILQGDVSDTYKSLPSKVLSGYQFVTEYFTNASEFFVSTDDDCFINIPNTYEYFRHLDPAKKEAVHCGFLYDNRANRIINMRSKWGVPEEVYPIRAYPKFCHGGMSILSYGILRDIYRVSLVTNYTGFHLEDVLTNGILRERLQRGDDSIRSVNLRDRITNKRLGLMWHLGYRKDKKLAFTGIWDMMRKRFSSYKGLFIPGNGYRVNVADFRTLGERSVDETIAYFVDQR